VDEGGWGLRVLFGGYESHHQPNDVGSALLIREPTPATSSASTKVQDRDELAADSYSAFLFEIPVGLNINLTPQFVQSALDTENAGLGAFGTPQLQALRNFGVAFTKDNPRMFSYVGSSCASCVGSDIPL
jgi:hypothetical protein